MEVTIGWVVVVDVVACEARERSQSLMVRARSQTRPSPDHGCHEMGQYRVWGSDRALPLGETSDVVSVGTDGDGSDNDVEWGVQALMVPLDKADTAA